MNGLKCLIFLLLASGLQPSFAQNSFQPAALFTTPESYGVQHTATAPVIDGSLDDTVWRRAGWTPLFADIEGRQKPAPAYETKVKMLWSDSCLFIAAYLQEPHVWATLKKHDDIVYYDNDFEVFIDPHNSTHQYYEIEVNAFNTVLDLFMPRPYRNGAAAMLGYDVAGLQTAVQVQGTLNNPADTDSSWTVEMAIPFRALYMGNRWRAPAAGALWRINFSRVQWQAEVEKGGYVKKKSATGKALPENNWVWSPQGVINMHYPERWGYLYFTKQNENVPFVLPYAEKRKKYLWLVYYRQQQYRSRHGRFAGTLQQLGITAPFTDVDGRRNTLRLEATSRQFMAYITDEANGLAINEEGFVQQLKLPL